MKKIALSLKESFTEANEIKTIDWPVLIAWGQDDELSTDEHNMAIELAGSWVTCAAGRQCAVLPRQENGQPVDYILHDLGTTFYYDVLGSHWHAAQITLSMIEQRTAFLLTQPDYRVHVFL